jgi:hypothetical protein
MAKRYYLSGNGIKQAIEASEVPPLPSTATDHTDVDISGVVTPAKVPPSGGRETVFIAPNDSENEGVLTLPERVSRMRSTGI